MGKKILEYSFVFTVIVLFMLIVKPVKGYSETHEAVEKARSILFNNAEQSLKNAEQKNAALYSPDLFKDAMEDYKDAESSYKKGKELSDIEKKLAKARGNFDKAAEISDKAAVFFKTTKSARDDAEKVDAIKNGLENWRKAEDSFKDAIAKFGDGKASKAKDDAKTAESFYRKAELEGIKAGFLANTRKEIGKLKDLGKNNNAKKLLTNAEKLVDSASKELDRQRYNNDTAKKIAAQAGYEAKHASFVNAKIQKMIDSKATYEDLVIGEEADLTKLGSELGVNLTYDKGFDEASKIIVGAIQNLKNTIADKNHEIAQKDKTIAELNGKITDLENQVANVSKKGEELNRQKKTVEDELNNEKQLQAQREKKLQSIRAILKPEEGKVLLDGDNIIVRIYGLTFGSGKSDIEPRFYGILSRVKQIFEKYDGCKIVVEGHTDAVGDESKNQKLSEKRAESVKQYFLANSSITADRIKSVGYGSSHPVAKNTTKEGRAQNRRIDMVITPAAK